MQWTRAGFFLWIFVISLVLAPAAGIAAPYAAMVIDARTGKVLHSRNADTRLRPASLTKMMTLYVAFQAIEHGEISLDTMVTISANAAAEPPSKLGLKAGQRIKLRYLIRAAAIKSANDAATAIGEAISGSEAAFARRMTRTARAMGMSRTTFKNANGLTQDGHFSTARDMTTLGRHLIYDFPQYYNLFSRRTADAGVRTVRNTNRRFLDAYPGADGIKTGYTAASGYNLVASARRGRERIIVTVFGGRSTASRNAKVAELMDLGFRRAPSNAPLRRPRPPAYAGPAPGATPDARPPAGRIVRTVTAVASSPRPVPRPGPAAPPEALVAAIEDTVEATLEAVISAEAKPEPRPQEPAEAAPGSEAPAPAPPAVAAFRPRPRPVQDILLASAPIPAPPPPEPEIITRVSSSGGREWGINVGIYPTRYDAERVLLKIALGELGTLGEALRKPSNQPDGWHANFVGMTRGAAELACRRLAARATDCAVIGP